MKKVFCLFLSCIMCFLFLGLVACGCEHENLTLIEDTATCENDGVVRYKCDDCNKTIEKTSLKTEHDYSILVSDTATCISEGIKTYKCSKCSSTNEKTSSKLGHNFSGCMCSRCNEIKSDYKKITINFSSNQYHYSETFYGTSRYNWAVLSFTISNGSANLDVFCGGQYYYSGLIKVLDFYITLYDSTNNILVSFQYGYGPRSGKLFAENKTATLNRIISNGEICYAKLEVIII